MGNKNRTNGKQGRGRPNRTVPRPPPPPLLTPPPSAVKKESPQPDEKPLKPIAGQRFKWLIRAVVTVLGFLATWTTLFPEPLIEKDDNRVIGISEVINSQFAIKNRSPMFDVYKVQPTCYFDNIVLKSADVSKTQPTKLDLADRLLSGSSFDVNCFLPNAWISDISQADLILSVDYKWFGSIPQRAQQRFVLSYERDSIRRVWVAKGM